VRDGTVIHLQYRRKMKFDHAPHTAATTSTCGGLPTLEAGEELVFWPGKLPTGKLPAGIGGTDSFSLGTDGFLTGVPCVAFCSCGACSGGTCCWGLCGAAGIGFKAAFSLAPPFGSAGFSGLASSAGVAEMRGPTGFIAPCVSAAAGPLTTAGLHSLASARACCELSGEGGGES